MKLRYLLLPLLLFAVFPLSAQPADQRAVAQQQHKIVSRVYESTDGMLKYCHDIPPAQLELHRATIDRFWETYPEFKTLIEQYPLYGQIRTEFDRHDEHGEVLDPYYKARECDYYMQLVQFFVEDEEGAKDIIEWVDLLKQVPDPDENMQQYVPFLIDGEKGAGNPAETTDARQSPGPAGNGVFPEAKIQGDQ
ncbi:MAG: hypothetical protein LBL59_08175 [Xanthomonadaceae bacterium]|jgi:hypothetical protein|nr:hypothetical protein [Xanthomonadaceae bacterium]